MPATVIDIGTYSIKAIEAKPGKTPLIVRVAEIFNTTGFAFPADDMQAEQLCELIASFINDHKLPTNDIRLSLPENIVSTKVIQMPSLSDAELASAITWQAEQHIPIPQEELSLEYQVLKRPNKKDPDQNMTVLLVGARKPIVDRYADIFINLGIEPRLMETHMLSIIRALDFEAADPTTLIAHIGASSMSIAIVTAGQLEVVFNHQTGGQVLSKTLEQKLGLSAEQAEEYKRQFGLDPQHFQGKVKEALLSSVNIFSEQVQKAIRFYNSQRPKHSVQRVVLSGGTAQLPGLIEYFGENLGIEVLLSAPFATAKGKIPAQNHQAMIVCMGLINREL